jgi:hypothetical protein
LGAQDFLVGGLQFVSALLNHLLRRLQLGKCIVP